MKVFNFVMGVSDSMMSRGIWLPRKLLPDCRLSLPKHLEGRVAEFRRYSFDAIPMAVIKKAIANSDFLKNAGAPAPPMVLAVEEGDGVIK